MAIFKIVRWMTGYASEAVLSSQFRANSEKDMVLFACSYVSGLAGDR